MRVERIQRHAIAVRRVRDRARLRRPESFADEDKGFARLRLIAEPARERLQCRRYHLGARRFSRLRVTAHEVALELGARRVVTGVPLEACDDLAYQRAILCEGDRVEWIEWLHKRHEVVVAQCVDELRQRCAGAYRRIARAYVKLVEKDADA